MRYMSQTNLSEFANGDRLDEIIYGSGLDLKKRESESIEDYRRRVIDAHTMGDFIYEQA